RRYRLWPASRPSAPYLKHHTDCGLGGRQYGTSEDIATLQGQNNTSAARLGAVEERSSSLARSGQFAGIIRSCHRRIHWLVLVLLSRLGRLYVVLPVIRPCSAANGP